MRTEEQLILQLHYFFLPLFLSTIALLTSLAISERTRERAHHIRQPSKCAASRLDPAEHERGRKRDQRELAEITRTLIVLSLPSTHTHIHTYTHTYPLLSFVAFACLASSQLFFSSLDNG